MLHFKSGASKQGRKKITKDLLDALTSHLTIPKKFIRIIKNFTNYFRIYFKFYYIIILKRLVIYLNIKSLVIVG